MNYACVSKQPFITKKDFDWAVKEASKKKPLLAEAKSRREFIRSHDFTVNVDPSTKIAEIKVTKR